MPEVKDVKVDINKLKETIAIQKKEIHSKQIAMGGNGAPVKGNKKAFLTELVTSMRHGVKSSAIETIQAVNETVEMRNGVPQAVAKNLGRESYVPQNRNRQQVREQFNPNQPVQRTGASDWGMGSGNVSIPQQGRGMGSDEDRFDQEFSKANSDFDRKMMEYMSRNNPAMEKFIQSSPYAQRVQTEQIVVEEPHLLTEGSSIHGEKVNLEHMVETALRGAVTNIYTKQKIQDALEEYLQSDDFIDKVAKAINIIAKRNKAKLQGK
jgi:predicted nucleic-acid-binding protein